MSDRITGDWVRENLSDRFWLGRDRLAAQLDADADLAKQVVALKGERDEARGEAYLWRDQKNDLASRLERAERERDDWHKHYTEENRYAAEQCGQRIALEQEVAALRAAASQWAAVEKVRDHEMRDKTLPYGWLRSGSAICWMLEGNHAAAPDFAALAAKLDALAEARKPKEWRWRWPDGRVSGDPQASAEDAKWKHDNCRGGCAVRETVDAEGRIILTPEGRGDG